jgi:MATE family multidrug resistance protein
LILGVGLATTSTYFSNFLLIHIYFWLNKDIVKSKLWFFYDPYAIKNMPRFLKYGVPSALITMMGLSAYEVLSIYSGWLGVKQLATNIILMWILVILYMSPLGMTYGVTSLVGNSLGQNKPKVARMYAYLTVIVGVSLNSIVVTCVYFLKDYIFQRFTTDLEVLDLIDEAMFFYTLQSLFDFHQGLCGGPIRAMGYQIFATISKFI